MIKYRAVEYIDGNGELCYYAECKYWWWPFWHKLIRYDKEDLEMVKQSVNILNNEWRAKKLTNRRVL